LLPLEEKLNDGIVWFTLGPSPPDRKLEMRCVAEGMVFESANKVTVIAAVISTSEAAYFIRLRQWLGLVCLLLMT
jgi:hypothetical protein